jgi:putative ABC transport system permease protein
MIQQLGFKGLRRLTSLAVWRLQVPLAWRNLVSDKRRLARSAAGIGFAALLMMVELGFRDGYIESMLLFIRRLDGDIMLISSQKYQFDRVSPFSRRQLYQARGVRGVASARPLYMERTASIWRNPQNGKHFAVLTFAFDPDEPIFSIPEVTAKLAALRQPDTILVDRHARSVLGDLQDTTESELSGHHVNIVGTFWLGPNFFNDGNIVMSDRNFFKLLGGSGPKHTEIPDVEVGVIKVQPGFSVSDVQQALRAALPHNVVVLTKQQLINQEASLHAKLSPVGPIFTAGTLVGFAVGILISYQILFSELSDQLPQYATLKAMGYGNRSLIAVVLQQAAFYACVGYISAWMLCLFLFRYISGVMVGPMQLTATLTTQTFLLTLVMCMLAALLALRRVIAADPAEVF